METKFSIRFPLIITTLFAEITFELPTYKFSEIHTNKCSDRSIEVKLPALLGNYDRPTDRPGIREVSLPIMIKNEKKNLLIFIRMM